MMTALKLGKKIRQWIKDGKPDPGPELMMKMKNLRMMKKKKIHKNMIKKNLKRKKVGSGSLENETKNKNLLTLAELSPKEFVGLIDFSIKLKKTTKKIWKQTCSKK